MSETADYNDGQWHYLELDVNAYAQSVLGVTAATVNGVVVKGSEVYVDDIVISGSALVRSYGADVAYGLNWQNQASYVYYQVNDLGTVLAITDKEGHFSWAAEPDHFGNYRSGAMSSPQPDSLGLTGKFFDNESGLYYFNARWYDQERGRWMSADPIGYIGGVNLYGFVENDSYNSMDSSGLCPNYPDWWNPMDWFRYGFGDPFSHYFDPLEGVANHNDDTYRALGMDGNDKEKLDEAKSKIRDLTGEVTFAATISGLTNVSDILKLCKGSIKNTPLPSGSPSWKQISQMAMGDIQAGVKSGKPGYKTFWKLLTDSRFRK